MGCPKWWQWEDFYTHKAMGMWSSRFNSNILSSGTFSAVFWQIIVMLLVVIFFHNGVNQITPSFFWIEWLHPTLHIQLWCKKTAWRCGKKSGTSRKASVMTFRGNKPHIIKNPSIRRTGKVTQEIWWWMDERWAGVLPRIARYIQETQV